MTMWNNGKVLKKHQLAGAIIDIIDESKEYCFLITPYFKPWGDLSKALKKASIQKKIIAFIVRYESEKDFRQFEQINKDFGFDVFFIDRLHIKLYMNEKSAVISSMNLYDSSKEHNYELGYKIEEPSLIKLLLSDIIQDDLLKGTPVKTLPGRYSTFIEKQKQEEIRKSIESSEKRKKVLQTKAMNIGFCIRCGKEISKNVHSPHCRTCFNEWSSYNNWYYQEKYCHNCQTLFPTTKKNPICDECQEEKPGRQKFF